MSAFNPSNEPVSTADERDPATKSAALSALLEHQLSGLSQPISGSDSGGKEYSTISEMWAAFHPKSVTPTEEPWYKKAKEFWEKEENCPPTIDGVLGGFAQISPTDAAGSLRFIDHLRTLQFTGGQERPVALDVGAGIGRVTREVLLKRFHNVDLLEVSPRLTSAAPDFIGEGADRCRYYCTGMEQFEPSSGRYDVVWIQWVIGHLTDVDCVDFIRRCLDSLTKTGVIVVKDNTCEVEAFNVDLDDSSVTRSVPYLVGLFDLAGAEVVEFKLQEDFPDEIFPVPMFALTKKVL